MTNLTISAEPYGSDLSCMSIDWWQGVKNDVRNKTEISNVDIFGYLNG